MDLKTCGGLCEGKHKASEFLCLTLKLLQIQPETEIVLEFITNENHKYIRLLGAFYLRLVGKPVDVYRYLEPLLYDYRRIRYKNSRGVCEVKHVDELVNDLLCKDNFCDVVLPRIPRRPALEGAGHLMPKPGRLDLFNKTLIVRDNLGANPIHRASQGNAKQRPISKAECSGARDHSQGHLLPDDNEETGRGTSAWSNLRDAFGDPSFVKKERSANVEIEPRPKKPRTKMQNES